MLWNRMKHIYLRPHRVKRKSFAFPSAIDAVDPPMYDSATLGMEIWGRGGNSIPIFNSSISSDGYSMQLAAVISRRAQHLVIRSHIISLQINRFPCRLCLGSLCLGSLCQGSLCLGNLCLGSNNLHPYWCTSVRLLTWHHKCDVKITNQRTLIHWNGDMRESWEQYNNIQKL